MPHQPFKRGDVVHLRSGSPALTVTQAFSNGAVYVQWDAPIADGGTKRCHFNSVAAVFDLVAAASEPHPDRLDPLPD